MDALDDIRIRLQKLYEEKSKEYKLLKNNKYKIINQNIYLIMNNSEKLQEIELENYIIIVYFILLLLYLYANQIEVNYLKYKNEEDKEKYRTLLYIVFGTTFLITLFFSISSIKDLKITKDPEIYKLKELSTIANILVLIASIIIIYLIYIDKDIILEINP